MFRLSRKVEEKEWVVRRGVRLQLEVSTTTKEDTTNTK